MAAPPDLAERLLSRRDELARALHAANQEFAARIDEGAAFENLAERLETPREKPRLAQLALPAFAFALAAGVALVALHRREPTRIEAERASPVAPAPSSRELSLLRRDVERPSSSEATADSALRPDADTPLAARRSAPAAHSATLAPRSRPSEPRPLPLASAESDSAPAPDCLSLARSGATHDAEACFVERSRGSGLGAEMALYELGRLRRDVLGDSQGALAALEQHAARFPSGSLRREVEMSALGLLVQLGRSREALERSSALLATQAGGERRAELHLFRGHIFRRNLSDFRAAEREYQQAEALAGSSAAEATYLRGLCLEALSERAAALDAYRRYLSQPSRPRAAEVERRLERLSSP